MPDNDPIGNTSRYCSVFRALALLSPVILALLLFAWSKTSADAMLNLFAAFSYYIIFAMVLCWACVVTTWIKNEGFSLPSIIRHNRIGLGAALLLCLAIFFLMKPELRILSDETNLLAVSKSMVYDRTVLNQTMGSYYFGNFYPIEAEVEKRPLLFPFFVHIFHTLLGYGLRNAFLVNFLTLFALLSGVYLVARRKLDEPTSLAAILLVASYPIVTISATSAGFDLFAVLFTFLSLVALYGFMKKPQDNARFALLWMNLVMVANVRYESIIFLPLIVGGLWLLGFVTLNTIKRNLLLLSATALFMMPLAWQKILVPASKYLEPGSQRADLFAFSHLLEHLIILFKAQADFSMAYPFNAVINLLAYACLGFFLFLILKKKIPLEPYQRHFAVLTLILLAVSNTMYFAHYSGSYTFPTSARFFLGFAVACALAPILLKSLRPDMFGKYGLLILAIATFIPYHASAMTARFMNTMTHEAQHSYDFLERQGEKNVMVISDRPGQYTVLNYGAVTFGYANENAAKLKLLLQRHLYREIYAFQRIRYVNNRPIPVNTLSHAFHLSTLYEIQISTNEYLRISRVVPDGTPCQGV